MDQKLERLKKILAEVYDINAAQALLGWDQHTYMPPGGSIDRSDQMSTLSRIAHERFTSDEVGELLEDLISTASDLDPESNDAYLLRVARRKYDKLTRVPSSWISDFSRETTLAQSAWEKARRETDFSIFQEYLERIVVFRQQYAEFFKPYEHIYDPLLEDFEPGLKTPDVQRIFEPLRKEQVELIQAIMDTPQVEDQFLHQPYPEDKQWKFGVEVITFFGFDWHRGRQDKSAHPFTTGFGLGDIRITTRFEPEFLGSGLFGTMHECGHALYEQGIDPALRRSPLGSGASTAVHESQSRLWENLVGRSRTFWSFFYPRLQQIFSPQLVDVDLDTFYRGINKVEPSLIRVEADEATYNLHIMLRLELEIALMEGSLEVKQLPEVWNEKMQEYLGLTPPDVSKGVLQDIHWSGGMIGYFPTYALGNLIAAQIWGRIENEIPDVDIQMSMGVFEPILEWLREKIHRHGEKYEPQDLIKRVTGSKIESGPYIRYLKEKYTEIYRL